MTQGTLALVPSRNVSSSYKKVLAQVEEILARGRARAKAALEREEVRTWWEAADKINQHIRAHGGRAAYGEKVIPNFARDLGITERYLRDIVHFQRVFPIRKTSSELTLSHYCVLGRIEDEEERKLLYQKAVRENLSYGELLSEIRSRKLLTQDASLSFPRKRESRSLGSPIKTFGDDTKARKFPPLLPRRGQFFTYQIVKPRDVHNQPAFYSIDLGLCQRHDLKLTGIKNPKEGKVIAAVRILKSPSGDRYRFKRVKTPNAARLLYTCKATVASVHDDDTLWAYVDFGFRFWSEVKLRLRGIDAAEIEKGKKASDFVKRTLARVPFVVISVSGRDKFGRPLTDLFYLEGTDDREKVLKEGIYLNQQLLDLGLAKRV